MLVVSLEKSIRNFEIQRANHRWHAWLMRLIAGKCGLFSSPPLTSASCLARCIETIGRCSLVHNRLEIRYLVFTSLVEDQASEQAQQRKAEKSMRATLAMRSQRISEQMTNTSQRTTEWIRLDWCLLHFLPVFLHNHPWDSPNPKSEPMKQMQSNHEENSIGLYVPADQGPRFFVWYLRAQKF